MTRIEKGSIILYSPYVMGRLESLWGKTKNKMMDEQSKGNREENKNTSQSQVSKENEIESSNRCYRAHEFAPERFLSCCKPSHYKLTAFQAGPRVCMGEKLAFTEIKIVLAKLIYNFTFSFETEEDLLNIKPNQLNITCTPNQPLKIKFTPRR